MSRVTCVNVMIRLHYHSKLSTLNISHVVMKALNMCIVSVAETTQLAPFITPYVLSHSHIQSLLIAYLQNLQAY